MTAKKATTAKRGKAKNIFLKTEDLERIHALGAFIYAKGHRPSDSQVIAAALRVAKTDAKLLKAFEEGLLLDARFKRDD